MPRKLARLSLVLIVGAAATVLVAGAACLWSYPLTTTVRVGEEARRLYSHISEQLDWGPGSANSEVKCQILRGIGFTHYVFTIEQRNPPKISNGRVVEWNASTTGEATEYGWPLRCFIADNLAFASTISKPPRMNTTAAVQELFSKSRPLPLPFLVNVLIYAAALLYLPGLPRRIRAVFWSRTGRCPACGYPRGASQVCSECGQSFTSKPVETA